MKIKKLVSALSALTIAAGAFAGMAVTASAAETPLPKINDDYTSMTQEQLDAEVAKYATKFNASESVQASFTGVQGEGLALYNNNRRNYTIRATRTLETTYDEKDILIAGTWFTDTPTIGSGNYVYLSFKDSSNNEVFRLQANRNDYYYGYTVGGSDEYTKSGELNSASPNADMNFKVIFDAKESVVESITINGETTSLNTKVDATDVKYVEMGRAYVGTDPKGRQKTTNYLRNLTIQEVPVPTSIAITGENEISAGNRAEYTATVVDQYGDAVDYDGDINITLKEAVEGVTLEGNTVSVAETGASASTFTLVATSADGYYLGEKTVSIVNPYAAPTATYEQIGDYTTETGDTSVDTASAFTFTVNTGSETVTSISVKVNEKQSDKTVTTKLTDTSAVFAVAVNIAAEDVTSITAVVNGEDVEASPTTTVE